MSFQVDIGYASERGPRERNEDFAGALRDAAGEGLIAAVADGVASGGLGREAAQTAVRGLLGDFFAAPPTWETTVTLDRLIGAHNRWLADHNRRRAAQAGGSALCTLTALVLQGHGWTLAHVGDTRAWLLRGGECRPLTEDHALDHLDFGSRLTRALGLDEVVHVDYRQGDLQAGDTFVLTSDGVHGALARARIAVLLGAGDGAQSCAEALVDAALAAGGRDNATALVLRVRGLAPERLDDVLRHAHQLPVPGPLKVGDRLDGYGITALIADNGVHRLYQARDAATRDLVAIKTLHEARAGDPQERAMLAHEAWLGLRVGERFPSGASAGRFGGAGQAHVLQKKAGTQAPRGAVPPASQGFVRVRELHDPSAFYVVFDWHAGQTLEQRLAAGHRFTVAEVVAGAIAVAQALGRLHRQGVIHRDIKPANLHQGADGRWRILDLGVALSGREPAALRSLHAGTPSYINPEQWGLGRREPAPADAGSDLYALGVSLFRWLGLPLPYGEVEPYQAGRFRRDPPPPSRRRPDVPIWLDHVLLKAVARESARRFETAEELVLALERGASRPLDAPPATPLLARDPAALWQIGLAVSLLFNGLLVVWLLFLPR